MGFRRLCLCSNNSAAKCREKSNNGNLYLVSNTVKQFSTETPLLEPLSKVEGTCSSISVLVKNVDKLATDSKLFGNYGNISRSYLDIAEQYLSEGKFEMALSNFQFALSYSTRDTQYIPYHGIARALYSKMKTLSVKQRQQLHIESKTNADRALQEAQRLKDLTAISEIENTLVLISQVPYQVTV